MTDKFDDLERLGKLLDDGKINRAEYEDLKKELLSAVKPSEPKPPPKHQAPSDARKLGAAVGRAIPKADSILAPPGKAPIYTKVAFWLVVAIIVLVVIANIGGSSGSSGRSGGIFVPNAPPVACTSNITYEITGTAWSVSLTLENSGGNTEQVESVRVPWNRTLTFPCGDFMYVSAQNNGDSGTVTCRIRSGTKTIETATSSGAYVIATCSGSAPG